MSFSKSFVVSLATILKAIPMIIDQNNIPRYSPSDNDFSGLEKIFKSISPNISASPPGETAVLAADK